MKVRTGGEEGMTPVTTRFVQETDEDGKTYIYARKKQVTKSA